MKEKEEQSYSLSRHSSCNELCQDNLCPSMRKRTMAEE